MLPRPTHHAPLSSASSLRHARSSCVKVTLCAVDLMRWLGVTKVTLADLARRGIAVRGKKRGTYAIESITAYCDHLRDQAAGRGGETGAAARARLGSAQASLAEAKAKALAGALVEADAVEALWTRKMRTFRNRVLAVPSRVKHLSARHGKLCHNRARARFCSFHAISLSTCGRERGLKRPSVDDFDLATFQ
jgi:phage terminase Nu1 subunit (DNA packaging protein)